jgi:hypothetical protein
VIDQYFSGAGQFEALPYPFEQRQPEHVFERLNRPADRRRRHIKHLGGASDRAELCHGLEIMQPCGNQTEPVRIHRYPPVKLRRAERAQLPGQQAGV